MSEKLHSTNIENKKSSLLFRLAGNRVTRTVLTTVALSGAGHLIFTKTVEADPPIASTPVIGGLTVPQPGGGPQRKPDEIFLGPSVRPRATDPTSVPTPIIKPHPESTPKPTPTFTPTPTPTETPRPTPTPIPTETPRPTPTPTPTETPRPTPTPTPTETPRQPEAPAPIPEVCVLFNGTTVPLPPEFRAQLAGKDAQTVARMLAEFKCEFKDHVAQTKKDHEEIKTAIDTDRTETKREHGEQDRKLEEIGRNLGIPDSNGNVAPNSIPDRLDKIETAIKNIKSGVRDRWEKILLISAVAFSGLAAIGAWLPRRRRPEPEEDLPGRPRQ